MENLNTEFKNVQQDAEIQYYLDSMVKKPGITTLGA
jgi:hypothetical protein